MKNLSNKNHHRIKHLKRIPLPYNQGKKNNIENTEEDEEETIETNQLKEYKRKLSDYPPKNNANRNIRIALTSKCLMLGLKIYIIALHQFIIILLLRMGSNHPKAMT